MSNQSKKIQNILIIRLSSIGDIVLTFWVLEKIFKTNKNISIDLMLDKKFSEIIYPLKYANLRILKYDKRSGISASLRWNKKIREQKYDYIIDLQNNFRSWLMTTMQRVPVSRMVKNRLSRWLFVHFRKGSFGQKHVVDKYMATLPPQIYKHSPIGSRPDLKKWNAQSAIRNKKKKTLTIVIFPGAKHKTKMWPEQKYRDLIEKIREQQCGHIILAGDSSDAAMIANWNLIEQEDLQILAGKTNLRQTWELLQEADLLICNDSAPMHMAAWLGIPTISIWGSTSYHFGFRPLNSNGVIVEENKISCRPCSHLGYEKCPRSHFDCMNKLSVDRVYSICQSIFDALRE